MNAKVPTPQSPKLVAKIWGAAGAIGFRFDKIALGAGVGSVVGAALGGRHAGVGPGAVAAATIVAYRGIAAVAWRGRENLRVTAEGAPAGDVGYVVPMVERQGYVGVDYLRRYAESTGAAFTRGPADIGIIDSLDDLAGPDFDPALVHPLIREFYEHTSRFRLSITPRWRRGMRLPYLAYRSLFARPLGQANAPFALEELVGGVDSWIDVIDVDHDGVPDFRAWVRAYRDTGEPVYVGIYTTVRHEGSGYVSVGFPLPGGSFTATLAPSNEDGDNLLLSSGNEVFPGHYLAAVDPETREVTALRLTNFDEEIHVFVEDGLLRTDHRFLLAGVEFMTLHYEIERI